MTVLEDPSTSHERVTIDERATGARGGHPPICVVVINPNTTVSMTETMVAALARHLGVRAEIVGLTARSGSPVIASPKSYAAGADAAVEAYRTYEARHDAVILGCFGDPGLEALREMARVPVVGLAEATFDTALARGERFGIVTVGPAWKAMLRARLAVHPAGALCGVITALDGTGLDFAGHPTRLVATLDAAARELVADGLRTVILGGAALAGLTSRMTASANFIDCVAAAADRIAEIVPDDAGGGPSS